jgi:hypothetical protein
MHKQKAGALTYETFECVSSLGASVTNGAVSGGKTKLFLIRLKMP